MAKFRKKPVVIEAWQFEATEFMPQPLWLHDAMTSGKVHYRGGDKPYYTIDTLEGRMRASAGDWIIQGVKGEIYPCKPDIFASTYEPEDAADDEDGVDPTTSELLKPRGNGGIVTSFICYTALLLVGDVEVTEEDVASWSIEQRHRAYDWAMRVHLHASDNEDVFVPQRPDCIRHADRRAFR